MRIKIILLVAMILVTAAVCGCGRPAGEVLPSSTVNQTRDEFLREADFSFSAKLVSQEEAVRLIGHEIPLPEYLSDGYIAREIFVGAGNRSVIVLFSDKPIERIDTVPSKGSQDYPIHDVKCKMRMYVSFEQDLRAVGGKVEPSLIPISLTPTDFYGDTPGGHIVDMGIDVNGDIASLRLYAAAEAADKETLKKIAQSMH